jgi:hypothetical protein
MNSIIWTIIQLAIVVLYIVSVKKFKRTERMSAILGFIFLSFSLLMNLARFDKIAGWSAEFAWIFFTISFTQQFIHFIRVENHISKKE